MRVAVTGGTGCLGRPLVARLIDSGFDVRLLVLPQENVDDDYLRKAIIIRGSLESSGAIASLVEGCDVVFHLAGKVHSVLKDVKDDREFAFINYECTKKLLKTCSEKKVKRFVFYSTVGVYGKSGDFHGNEQSPCNPVSAYAISKLDAEKVVLSSADDGGPLGVVLRFPVVYGPWDRGNVCKLIKSINGGRFFYFGDGRFLRSMISSVNAAEAAYMASIASLTESDVFCVTDGSDYHVRELIEEILRAVNKSWKPYHIPVAMAFFFGMIGDLLNKATGLNIPFNSEMVMKLSAPLTFSCEKAKSVLQYKPVETLRDGIAKEVKWLFNK
jgi:nucleoside-diphosphate-sugar epimerase